MANIVVMRHDIPIPVPTKRIANPGQIKTIDNRDDRLEICTLLKHLPPLRRLEFFRWACSQAVLPGTHGLHPGVGELTFRLTREARHCDYANEQLTIDIISSLSHMWIDYSLDASKCLERLVMMVKGKKDI